MRALLLSDIHGNVHALQAVLAAAHALPQGYDVVWNLGDMVGYGARPNQVIDTLRALPTPPTIHVRGNHDRVCCGLTSSQGFNPIAAEAADWTQRTLTPDNRQWLRDLPCGPIRASALVLCAHGSPLHEDHYIVSMRDAWAPLQRMDAAITFFGHTHVQGGFSQAAEEWEEVRPLYPAAESEAARWTLALPPAARHLINPGSVGQPRDRDWRAAFALYDDTAATVTFHRVPYDLAAAQAAIRDAGLPERLAARLATGR